MIELNGASDKSRKIESSENTPINLLTGAGTHATPA
jgi:hypothetical protein